MGWFHFVVRLLCDRTADGVMVHESTESEFLLGSARYTANYVCTTTSSDTTRQETSAFVAANTSVALKREETDGDEEQATDEAFPVPPPPPPQLMNDTILTPDSETLFTVLEHASMPLPTWSSRVVMVLVGPRAETVSQLARSLTRLRDEAGAPLSRNATAAYVDGTEKDVSLESNGRLVAIADEANLCSFVFSLGEMRWTIVLTYSLAHSPELVASLAAGLTPIAVQLFVTVSDDEQWVNKQLNAVSRLQRRAAEKIGGTNVEPTGIPSPTLEEPTPEEAVSLLQQLLDLQVQQCSVQGESQLRVAMSVIENSVVLLPAEWEEERKLYEEEIALLEGMAKETKQKLVAADSAREEKEARAAVELSQVKQEHDRTVQQREFLEKKCREFAAELKTAQTQSHVSDTSQKVLQSRLFEAEETMGRTAIKQQEMNILSDLHFIEREELLTEHRRLLHQLASTDLIISQEVERIEAIKEGVHVKEFELVLSDHRKTQLELVKEFQEKELRWQKILKEFAAEKDFLVSENERLKENSGQLLKTLKVAQDAAQVSQQEDDERFERALKQVREMSPPRAVVPYPQLNGSSSLMVTGGGDLSGTSMPNSEIAAPHSLYADQPNDDASIGVSGDIDDGVRSIEI